MLKLKEDGLIVEGEMMADAAIVSELTSGWGETAPLLPCCSGAENLRASGDGTAARRQNLDAAAGGSLLKRDGWLCG